MLVPFSKIHVLGNDFIILNHIAQPHPITASLIRQIADRHTGLGCDQVLVVEPPLHAENDFFYRIYNANGQEVEFCGNGACCFAYYVLEQRLTPKRTLYLETLKGLITVTPPEDPAEQTFTVSIPPPSFHPEDLPTTAKMNTVGLAHLSILQKEHSFRLLSLGNPHCVLRANRLDDLKIDRLGQALNMHPAFPKGINVIGMQVKDRSHIQVRVYERGVGETQACGSGACAAVVSGIISNVLDTRVQVDLPGGSVWVEWPERSGPLRLSASPTLIAHGQFSLNPSPRF